MADDTSTSLALAEFRGAVVAKLEDQTRRLTAMEHNQSAGFETFRQDLKQLAQRIDERDEKHSRDLARVIEQTADNASRINALERAQASVGRWAAILGGWVAAAAQFVWLILRGHP